MRAQKKNKRLEAELQELDEFLSHVLRSYMISICGFTSLLSEEVKKMSRGKRKKEIQRIEQSIWGLYASIEGAVTQIRSFFPVRTHDRKNNKGRIQ